MANRVTTALVTGASRGLGRALAVELAAEGVEVVAVARGEEALARVVDQIRADGGVAHGLPADVGDPTSVHALAGAAAAVVGPLDLLVHNASTLGAVPMPELMATRWQDMERVLQVNLLGPFRLTQAMLGPMLLRRGGAVVAVSSDAAVEAYPGWGAYGVSKAALDHLMRVWAAELVDSGVRLITVDPGEMDTRMHADAMPEADPSTLADPAEVARWIVARIADVRRMPNGSRLAALTPQVTL